MPRPTDGGSNDSSAGYAVSPDALRTIAKKMHDYWNTDCTLLGRLDKDVQDIPDKIAFLLKLWISDDASQSSLKYRSVWTDWYDNATNAAAMLLTLSNGLKQAADAYQYTDDSNAQQFQTK